MISLALVWPLETDKANLITMIYSMTDLSALKTLNGLLSKTNCIAVWMLLQKLHDLQTVNLITTLVRHRAGPAALEACIAVNYGHRCNACKSLILLLLLCALSVAEALRQSCCGE